MERSFAIVLGEACAVGLVAIAFHFILDQFVAFVHLKMFLVGFLAHFVFELAGLNEAYCGYAKWT